MSKFITRATGAAFVCAVVASFATAASAQPVTVKVSDINTASADGLRLFGERVEVAARKFCSLERSAGGRLDEVASCRKAVRLEMNEKLQGYQAQLAKRAGAQLASS